jgi:TDG/mug DNA glycosylase family protein
VAHKLPDIIARDLSVVFCGINPGLSSAAGGHHFIGRSNRFWRVVHLAGFTPSLILPENDRSILQYGFGLTTAVERPTTRADELSPSEFIAERAKLERKIQTFAPSCIAFLGKAAFAAISAQREVAWGRQEITFVGARVWILPNPSGLNRSWSLDALVGAYRELQVALKQWPKINRRAP